MKKENQTRRSFIRQTTLAGGILAVPELIPFSLFNDNQVLPAEAGLERVELSGGWKIRSFEPRVSLLKAELSDAASAGVSNNWISVPGMPAMVHKTLLQQNIIGEPWKPFGMEKCYWVSQKDWVYAVSFPAKKTGGDSMLVFRGLTGSVDIYLNGKKIASHADNNVPLIMDVTGLLLDRNTLVLHFEKAAPDVRPGQEDPALRKPNGTYLGPNPQLYTSGIKDKVFLQYTHGSLMTEIVAGFTLDESLSEGSVSMDVSGKSDLSKISLRLRLLAPDGKVAGETTLPVRVSGGNFHAQPILQISNPALWWPRGYGDQNLYKTEISLLAGGVVHQQESKNIGFRRITMPETFHFVVNGVPVFVLGGDWVTPDLLSQTWDQQRHDMLFDLAENANFNAYRVWGPADAPHDNFYEMADERGFLIWQDFTRMSMRPDEESKKICVEKATFLLKRLKHHPSVLCWNGINEAAMWAHEDYNKDFTDHGPWQGLPAALAVGEVCAKLDPDRYYVPSSPYFGENHNDPKEGSTHGYTNMWFVPGYD